MKLINFIRTMAIVSFIFYGTRLFAQHDTLVYCFIGDRPYDKYDNLVNRNDTVIFILRSTGLNRNYQFGEFTIRRVEYRRSKSIYTNDEVLDILFFSNQSIDPIIKIPLIKYIERQVEISSILLLIDIQGIYEKRDNKLNNIEYPRSKLEFDFKIMEF